MTTDISVVRWDPAIQQDGTGIVEDYEYDGGNSSSRLFERSRIKALAGEFCLALGPGKNIKNLNEGDRYFAVYRHPVARSIEWGC